MAEKGVMRKMGNNISWKSGSTLTVIQSFEVKERVVLKGPAETVNKIELMLGELY